MTKSELIEILAEKTDMSKHRAESVVNCVFDSMMAAMAREEIIEIRGFGTFTVRSYGSYNGRNPRTGETVSVPEKRLPFFKVAKALKSRVNGGSRGEGSESEE